MARFQKFAQQVFEMVDGPLAQHVATVADGPGPRVVAAGGAHVSMPSGSAVNPPGLARWSAS